MFIMTNGDIEFYDESLTVTKTAVLLMLIHLMMSTKLMRMNTL